MQLAWWRKPAYTTPKITVLEPVRFPPITTQDNDMTRISTCPETGKNLNELDIRKHAATLWPQLDTRDGRYAEATKRRAALLAEADARDADAAKHAAQHSGNGGAK